MNEEAKQLSRLRKAGNCWRKLGISTDAIDLSGIRNFFLTQLLVFTLLSPLTGQSGEWQLKDHDGELQVYYRKPADSKINEIKVETTVEARLSAIIAVLKDIPAYPRWIYKCQTADKLQSPSATESIYHSEMDFPWPMSNRDFIARSRLRQDPGNKKIHILVKNDPDYLPKKKGIVRIPQLEINWDITPLSGKKVRISYHIKSDPGGMLPAWLINLAIDQGPVNSMKKFREMLEEEKYRNAHLDFIAEP